MIQKKIERPAAGVPVSMVNSSPAVSHTPAMAAALREWRQLMRAEIRLRERIHHQHRLIINHLEKPAARAEMRDTLNKANNLLVQLKNLLGEAGATRDVLGYGR